MAHLQIDWSWAIKRFHDYPFEEVQRKMVSRLQVVVEKFPDSLQVKGHAPPSFLLTYLEEFSKPDYAGEHSLDDLKHATGAIYAGGAETVGHLAMSRSPEFSFPNDRPIPRSTRSSLRWCCTRKC